jgi:hypothetical protein
MTVARKKTTETGKMPETVAENYNGKKFLNKAGLYCVRT